MCGIVGVFNTEKPEEKLKKALKVMENRGKDSSNIFFEDSWGIGHNLHAIVSKVPQPLDNKFVINCEIYNWKELCEKHNIKAENDAVLALKLIEKEGIKAIEEFDGVFAIALISNNKITLARDILGVKPLWFAEDKGFAFASEKKALIEMDYENVQELNPRKILTFENRVTLTERPFFKLEELKDKDYEKKTEKLLEKAILKRIPNQKIGLLFSGGIDSSTIAYYLKKHNIPFTCYTAAIEDESLGEAEDLVWAEKVAKELDLDLKVVKVPVKEVPKYLEKIVPLIEDANVVKVGVALPFYLACEEAHKDDVKVIFSGLGSEEIFAGYQRHEKSANINEECLYGLKQMYHRDLYRDDVITMYNSIELRLPFLDHNLIKYALNIPEEFKINEQNKLILRNIMNHLGDVAWRKKKAAQYGSKFDRAIKKLAKKETKSEYLRKFLNKPNFKLGALFSGGKDSTYAIHLMKEMNYEISCLISLISENLDSYMFHTPNISLVDKQAELMNIPLIKKTTKGIKEEELEDLRSVIKEAKEKLKLDGIVTGALFSTYQRNRIETICDELNLRVFSPLWHKDQEEEMRELIRKNFKIVFSAIAAYGLNKTWLGREITEKDVDSLVKLNKETGLNVAGEGGEFESLVINCPLFEKELNISGSVEMEDEYTGRFQISN